jgi:beta-phosphoglucomutase-like phosphatase (HAD superfamily)
MRTKLRAILLDFEGTIAQTERCGQRLAYNQAFSEMGLDWVWTEELYAELLRVAGGKQRLRHYFARYRPELLDRAVSTGLIDALHQLKARNFAAIAPALPFRPGIQRLVYEAHFACLRVAIVTSAPKRAVEALISQDSAFAQMIDVIAASEAVERKKPAPDVYEWALKRLALVPDECVAIEDSKVGLRAALGAGLATIVTVSEYTADEDFSGAAAVLSELGDADRPARSLSGPSPTRGIVDLDFLEKIRFLEQIRSLTVLNSIGEYRL